MGLKYAEDSAQAEVLDAHRKRLAELNKKIRASLNRIQETGSSLEAAVGPAYNDTQQLQVVNRNVDNLLAALERTRQPLEGKADEERIVREGYVGSTSTVTVAHTFAGPVRSDCRHTSRPFAG